ncbi:hypothetical protein Vadar_026869 [Vaccinium darrowii]|uniref:Uncharacterized protein n=1 Tax=Vaccinium darrowii TaxID=229202 RepID=A0ACB7XK36_9ERIC|nr:hypothetical protein Vadar_026869 [Vaccinium darrowii]
MESSEPPPRYSVLHRLIDIDTAVSLHLHSTAQPFLPRSLLKTLEISGDGRLFFPLVISLLLSPTTNTTTSFTFSLLSSLLIGAFLDLLLVGLIKHLVRRPRPIYNKDMFLSFSVDHWSFPSGHSSRVCFVATFLSLSSAQLRFPYVEYVVFVACLWAAATSISRVLLGRHFLCDVIAGVLLGLLEAILVFRLLNYSILASYFFS